MVSNKLAVLAASAALFESALGFNSHRHLHKKAIDKRAMETDWVTEWVTVWVTPGQGDAVPASCTGTVTATTAAAESAAAYVAPKKHRHTKVSTTTSTTVLVVPTTTASAAVNYGGVDDKPQTTLSTAVKPATEPEVVVQPTTSTEPAAVVQPTTTTQQEVVAAVSSSTSVYVAPTSKAAVVTTTSAAAKAESTGSSSTFSGSSGISLKRGIAYNDANLANSFASDCPNCGWAYNWGSAKGDLDDSVTFIPTFWGPTHADGWTDNVDTAIAAGTKVLFSLNEPDMPNQASMSPADAAAAHVQYMNPFKDKALIASPSVSNSGTDGEGLSYLAEWISACEALDEPCHFDFCNIHWYSAAQYSDTLFTQIEKAKDVCGGKPIWLTEFAPTDTDPATINSFMEDVIPKLEAIDYLEGYSYFMVATGNLMTDDTTLSEYGQTYAGASA